MRSRTSILLAVDAFGHAGAPPSDPVIREQPVGPAAQGVGGVFELVVSDTQPGVAEVLGGDHSGLVAVGLVHGVEPQGHLPGGAQVQVEVKQLQQLGHLGGGEPVSSAQQGVAVAEQLGTVRLSNVGALGGLAGVGQGPQQVPDHVEPVDHVGGAGQHLANRDPVARCHVGGDHLDLAAPPAGLASQEPGQGVAAGRFRSTAITVPVSSVGDDGREPAKAFHQTLLVDHQDPDPVPTLGEEHRHRLGEDRPHDPMPAQLVLTDHRRCRGAGHLADESVAHPGGHLAVGQHCQPGLGRNRPRAAPEPPLAPLQCRVAAPYPMVTNLQRLGLVHLAGLGPTPHAHHRRHHRPLRQILHYLHHPHPTQMQTDRHNVTDYGALLLIESCQHDESRMPHGPSGGSRLPHRYQVTTHSREEGIM